MLRKIFELHNTESVLLNKKNDKVWGKMKIPKDHFSTTDSLKGGGPNSTPKKPKYTIK